MGLLILWVMMGGVVAIIANSKGFDSFGWFLYGALVWPIALAHVLVAPARKVSTSAQISDPQRKCPDCAETIKQDAVVCRFCGKRDLPLVSADERDAWFDSLEHVQPPVATTWQKLWWNPHGRTGRR